LDSWVEQVYNVFMLQKGGCEWSLLSEFQFLPHGKITWCWPIDFIDLTGSVLTDPSIVWPYWLGVNGVKTTLATTIWSGSPLTTLFVWKRKTGQVTLKNQVDVGNSHEKLGLGWWSALISVVWKGGHRSPGLAEAHTIQTTDIRALYHPKPNFSWEFLNLVLTLTLGVGLSGGVTNINIAVK